MTDIVERLREQAWRRSGAPKMNAGHTQMLEWEAADEIERLRKENAQLLIENRDLHIDLALARLGESVHGGWPDVASVSISTQHDQHVRVWRAHHLLRAQLIASAAKAR